MVTVQKAVEAAAAKDGSTVIYTSPSDATGAAQIPFVNQLISQSVDVIMISGSDLNSTSAALAKAKAGGHQGRLVGLRRRSRTRAPSS